MKPFAICAIRPKSDDSVSMSSALVHQASGIDGNEVPRLTVTEVLKTSMTKDGQNDDDHHDYCETSYHIVWMAVRPSLDEG